MRRAVLRHLLAGAIVLLSFSTVAASAGPAPAVLHAAPLAQSLGVERYEISQQGSSWEVTLLSAQGEVLGHVARSCGCRDGHSAGRLSLEAEGQTYQLRWNDAGAVARLDGKAVPAPPAAGSGYQLAQLGSLGAGRLAELAEALAAETFVDLWDDAAGEAPLLVGCPACPPTVATRPTAEVDEALSAAGWTCGKRGYWRCTLTGWGAGTSFRSMQGTQIECGGGLPQLGIPGYCGDMSHTQDETWVDIVGGLSQTCEDHSTSFFGPLAGEWHGCSGAYQESTGYQAITGINSSASFWPFQGGRQDIWDDGYCYPVGEEVAPPPYVWYRGPATFYVGGAFATVYDLDFCAFKQLMGTIYWPTFAVTSQLLTDTETYKVARVAGGAGVACAGPPGTSCENTGLCADLAVTIQQECTWTWHEPRTRCDAECS